MNITDLADDILGLIELEVKKKRRHQMIKKELDAKVKKFPAEMATTRPSENKLVSENTYVVWPRADWPKWVELDYQSDSLFWLLNFARREEIHEYFESQYPPFEPRWA